MSISLLMLAFSPVEMILLAVLFLSMASEIVLAFAGFLGGRKMRNYLSTAIHPTTGET